MNIINKTKSTLNREIKTIATNNIIKKLKTQGISYKDLSALEFEDLLKNEIEILKSDTKKVGAGVGIGIFITMLTGF